MRVEFALDAVTPLFLGGAEPNQAPELRPASFRGALRYWYRALMGGTGPSLETLRRIEGDVFGTTEEIATVTVRLRGTMRPFSDFDLDRDEKGQQLPTGHNYLYYSTKLGDNNRKPFAPGESIALVLDSRFGAFESGTRLEHACAAVWLLTHLGGLGMRARRCAGSLQVSQVLQGGCNEIPSFPVTSQTADQLRKDLSTSIRTIRALAGASRRPALEFDVIHPDVCRVWVIGGGETETWSSWKDGVDAIGSAMQSFRAGQGPTRNTLNSIFGVPILHGEDHRLKRRASPLWLRITKLATGACVGVATLFKADFKPGAHEVGGGYALIERFIASFPTNLEVEYT